MSVELRVKEATSHLYVSRSQKVFTYMGYYANAFARASARNIERLTHRMPQEKSYWREVAKRVGATLFSATLAACLFVPAFGCYAVGAYVGSGRFELMTPKSPADFWQERSVKAMSLNACLQDPWSPLTGGVVTPFDPIGQCASRVAALANAIAEEGPVVFVGQEFENLAAQDEFIRLMRQKGYPYSLRDLGSNHPVSNNSGLFAASKVPLQNIEFVPFPAKDKEGLSKWSAQGALTFTISVHGKDLRIINTHLNYGEGEKNQAARNRQLTHHVVPLLKRGPAVGFGDLNFNTGSVAKAASGLLGFVNALEGKVTCTDEGKHTLRGKSKRPNGKPCTDCEERIDGLLYDPTQVKVLEVHSKPLRLSNQLLSDHYATVSVLQIGEGKS